MVKRELSIDALPPLRYNGLMTAGKIVWIVVGIFVVLMVLSVAAVGLAPSGGGRVRDIRDVEDPACSGLPTLAYEPDTCVVVEN